MAQTLAVLLPTRGRPDNLKRFMNAFVATAENSRVLVYLDRDDPESPKYEEIVREYGDWILVCKGERMGFGPSLNELALVAKCNNYSHVGMFADDVVPETVRWDTALVEGLNGRLGVTYGDDGLRDKHAPDLPTHYVTQTEVYERLGYLSPPGIRHLFVDNVARDVGRTLRNLTYVPVKITHLHPWVMGEEFHDQTYEEGGRNHRVKMADRKIYLEWASETRWKQRLRA